jgi:hypothetical protein
MAARPRRWATRPAPPLKLTPKERDQALAVRHAERFVDASPTASHATRLDELSSPLRRAKSSRCWPGFSSEISKRSPFSGS